MTKKEAIVKYISEMDIDMLSLILENDTSFMNIYKEDFLVKFQEMFIECRENNIYKFSKVIPGVCEEDSEINGLEGYKFITGDKRALTLLFEEENNDIIEIYNCEKFKSYQNCEETEPIYISVYDDEKIDYIPTFEHIALTNRIETFYAQFEDFKNSVTLIEDFDNWYNTIKEVYDSINLFEYMDFKFYFDFSSFVVGNMFAHFIVENGEISKKALEEYKNIDSENEFEILEWLFKYQDVSSVFGDELKKADDWEKRSLVIHKEEESIVLDCSKYRSSFKFEEIYDKHYDDQKINGI
ncbi:hypothetical protein [Lutibacter flavus]|uniref:Uncharacterized protein n=1 Tax=Lutibacter flavus TaxID=691689 RepID=A0A238YY22_9FLAO|nr:hypothetical protein [Lutibacter flavus]SNR75608.1 hypothetical protein SAMN04488111_2895 [Lutibacter flavus]